MSKRIQWRLSASKMESARDACKLFEEDETVGAEYKQAGTDGHSYLEDMDKPLTGLDPDLREKVEFCRQWSDQYEEAAGPFLLKEYELRVSANEHHPAGMIDRLYLTESLVLACFDFKLGTQPVPSPSVNPQILEYLYMARLELAKRGLPKPVEYIGGIIQPHLELIDTEPISVESIERNGEEMRELNEQLKYPFNQPQPGPLCVRCKWAQDCPAVTSAVQRFVDRAALLPMPEQFEPGALTTDQDRIIALDLAAVLARWAELVKKACKEYALANGNTISGVYNVSMRKSGFDVTDTRGFVDYLIKEGVISSVDEAMPYLKVVKTRFIDGITEVGLTPKAEVAEAVNQAVEACGEPKAPVVVMRRGGKRQLAQAQKDHNINVPQLALPSWMSKEK